MSKIYINNPSKIIERLKNNDIPLDFNWNTDNYRNIPVPKTIPAEPVKKNIAHLELIDEGLRDGLHGVSYFPTTEEMLQYIQEIYDFGVKYITVGIFPGFGNKVDTSIKTLLKVLSKEFPAIHPIVLSLSTQDSLMWTAQCLEANSNLNALIFVGTSPARMLVEEWSQNFVLKALNDSISWAVKHGIPVIGATEHTTQTHPDFLKKILDVQRDNGIYSFCIADTIGIIRPKGTYRIVKYVNKILNKNRRKKICIEWHGHRDLDNSTQNALTALASGAYRIHVIPAGIGERAGNTSTESIMLNLGNIAKENKYELKKWNMLKLSKIINTYLKMVKIQPSKHGMLSTRAFTSSLGIHSAAREKAEILAEYAYENKEYEIAKKLQNMSRTIYSAINPENIGRHHVTTIGPWSGSATIRLAYRERGGNPNHLSETTISTILEVAKKIGKELDESEINRLLFENNHS
jgi:2-isopropylmalate synthase